MGEVIGIDAFHCAETFAWPADALDPCIFDSEMNCPGDFNGDGLRAMSDVLALLVGFNQPANTFNPLLDLNGDGLVATSDLMLLLGWWGQPCN